jgi:hypothetical protein
MQNVKASAAKSGKLTGSKSGKAGKPSQMHRQQSGAEKTQEEDTGCKGPIALLQEFVQSSKSFPLPSKCSALQCTYDTRMASKATLEYRAVIAFFLDGVPHHTAGAWHASKKAAQRDSADRALRLFVGRWGEELLQFQPNEISCSDASSLELKDDEEKLLQHFCVQNSICSSGSLQWSIDNNPTTCQCVAVVELNLFGVPHKLAGAPKSTEKEARIDAARRALWYLQCPGFEDLYEPEPLTSGTVPPAGNWLNDDESQEAMAEANRKTVVMRTQNRLQQTYARQLQGVAVWEWTYETDANSEAEWPPIFRAVVRIPVLGKSFSGNWIRGQRDAQIDAISQVNAFLDEEDSASCR